MRQPGTTALDCDSRPSFVPSGAVAERVAWLNAQGRAVERRQDVTSVFIEYLDADGQPVMIAYGSPLEDR